uniref:ABC transporter domain-containing protein n=1 Tax=Mucochytrium quahogii TaxID=96639 RepID=A0A7S2SAY3_9STRA|mmetsp:Transcript_8866/g.14397  ORF Transcript_8866/g.14397 Transcript_8866/m.14397 type:complete len:606 (+) Transcript_8866:182-1999(+)|eukprot:CAMPEP_0203748842 /NCGR_PEP_ID=MMETSP0098-20131031/3610_1 /ASSEMBLY_ACC=CAM_ASM_000208 /TAXON_ID=96639 /ORGANISM=" , Strain NY0313808BC1" /LENGTH=605 /DNA_ID=CAMNT_0050637723 /DNA_START=166 /DNA_END=1986 /DNA_ORIENTATION=-
MATLDFKDIHYKVKLPKKKGDLHILKGVSGQIQTGRLFALLGSSGSGKTTLVDILSRRKQTGSWSGTVLLDGKPVPEKDKSWKKICGYVMQSDKLLSTATVFETLMFSIQLRSPLEGNRDNYVKKVHEVLEEVGLSHRVDARIGSESKRSLSGGELRRVSIAQELVADVKILFLDEPTSGLDSATAKSVMEVLAQVAHKNGKMIAATIHQPSSSIAELFDDMMLLDHGRACYFGPWKNTVSHFAAIGYPCPQYTNPTDFIMDLCTDEEVAKNLVSTAYDSCTFKTEMAHDENILVSDWSTPFWFQVRLCWVRSVRQFVRNELMLISELIQYIFCGLFIGLMYARFPSSLDDGVFDRQSAIFFVLTTLAFIPSFTVVTVFGEESPLMKREVNSGMYKTASTFIAKLLTTWPFEIFLSLIFSVSCYFICGFKMDAGSFFVFYLITSIFLLISETIGYMCAVVTPEPTIGVLLLSLVMIVCLALGGFLVSHSKVYYEWFENINFFVFALTAMTLNEFEGLTLYDTNGRPYDALQALRDQGRVRNNLSMWENILVLVVMLVILRAATLLLLMRKIGKSTFKRSEDPIKIAKVDVPTTPAAETTTPAAVV